jgi:hypothetical protein
MKVIELFPDGRIGIYEMPDEPIIDACLGTEDLWDEYNKKLEAAKRDAVCFNLDSEIVIRNIHENGIYLYTKTGKPYPVPDGYEVKIIEDMQSEYGGDYIAILVPKQESMNKIGYEREATESDKPKEKDNSVNTSRLMSFLKQQSIEEAATKFYKNLLAYSDNLDLDKACPLTHKGVIHFMTQFKQQKS